MNDRAVKGLIAGFLGGAVAKAWGLFSYYVLRFSQFLVLDWINVLFMGHPHRNLPEWLLGFSGIWLWLMVLGVGLAYLFPRIGTGAYLIKGVLYSVIILYAIYLGSGLFRMHDLAPMAWQTVVSDFVFAALFGLTAAYVLRRLDEPKAGK